MILLVYHALHLEIVVHGHDVDVADALLLELLDVLDVARHLVAARRRVRSGDAHLFDIIIIIIITQQ